MVSANVLLATSGRRATHRCHGCRDRVDASDRHGHVICSQNRRIGLRSYADVDGLHAPALNASVTRTEKLSAPLLFWPGV